MSDHREALDAYRSFTVFRRALLFNEAETSPSAMREIRDGLAMFLEIIERDVPVESTESRMLFAAALAQDRRDLRAEAPLPERTRERLRMLFDMVESLIDPDM